jgi:hypothetical protein
MLERLRQLSPPVAQPRRDRQPSVQAAETAPPSRDPITPPVADPPPPQESAPEVDAVAIQPATIDVLGLDAYTRISRPDSDVDTHTDD